jgi:hypothetical protein
MTAATPPAREASTPPAPRVGSAPGTSPLERAQESLPRGLRAVPLQALLAGVGLATTALLTLALAFAHGDKPIAALEEADAPTLDAGAAAPSSATPQAVPTVASAQAPEQLSVAELDAAKLAGADALTALAQRFPTEPTVLQALAVALAEKKDFTAAMRVVGRLFEIAPDRKADKAIQQVIVEVANGPADTAASAFEMLRTRMEAHGPDVLFELVLGGTSTYAKQHAGLALADSAVMKLATPALAIAEDLRHNRPCARKALLVRASADGDVRALPYLRPLVATKGCGGNFVSQLLRSGGECYSCFTPADRNAIANAIDTIDKRDKR